LIMSRKAIRNGRTPPPIAAQVPRHGASTIGNNKPEELTRVVAILEQELGRKADRQFLPMQPGDVPATWADIDDLARDVNFRPATDIEDGIRQFGGVVSKLS
jgi:UDP-glucuronate 4-epimerase